MVERFIGKTWEIRYYREMMMVIMIHRGEVVMMKVFPKLYMAVDCYASVKTVGDAKDLLEEV